MNILVIMMIPAFVLAAVVHTFMFQPFDTPSSSMAPNLVVGDKFFVSKYAYGYSRFSFPFPEAPPITGRILAHQPAYGDIVVFRLPRDTSTDYVKRLVGLPGDRIQMKNSVLHINGKPVVQELVFSGDACGKGTPKSRRLRERLPNGISYEIQDCIENGAYDNTPEYVVPAGHYFMMGDNRDNSVDSRILNRVGYVPFENIVGRFAFIYSSGAGE